MVVAFSGGVDSALLAVAAHRALPDRVWAVTAASASLASGELDHCERFATDHDLQWSSVGTHELDDERYLANAGDRCYWCKSALMDELVPVAEQVGATVVLGVNVDDLLISQPDHGEQALEIADTLVRSGAVDVLVVDSVAALVPLSELEGEMGDNQPGTQARLMSKALRKLTASINKSKTMVIFINQIRMKIGVMYGSPETTTGGNALKFYASVRLDIRRIGAIKEREEVVGNQTRVKVVKNKLAPPFKMVEFDIMYGEGVSKTGELIDLGVKAGVVEKSGAWFSYDSQRIGQGRENAKVFLKSNPDVAAKMEAQVRASSGIIADKIDEGPAEDDDDEAAEA